MGGEPDPLPIYTITVSHKHNSIYFYFFIFLKQRLHSDCGPLFIYRPTHTKSQTINLFNILQFGKKQQSPLKKPTAQRRHGC